MPFIDEHRHHALVEKRVRDTEAHAHQHHRQGHQRQRLCRQREPQAGQAQRQYQRAAKDRGVLPTRMQWANGDGKHGPRHGVDGPEIACHGRGQTTVELLDVRTGAACDRCA